MKMASPELNGSEIPEEFKTFEKVLKIIPTCQAFLKDNKEPGPSGSAQILTDWKKCVITELDAHLPAIVKGPETPKDNFFNCRKSVYHQCLSIVEFSRYVAGILEMLEGLNTSLYLLAEQHPRNGSITTMSSLFLLALKLIQVVPWDGVEKRIGEKVKKTLDEILKDLKTFRKESERLQNDAAGVGNAAGKVFKQGPYANVDTLMSAEGRRMTRNKDVPAANRAAGEPPGPQFGLTRSNDLILADGMVKLVRLSASLQLGLLMMILQHIKQLQMTSNHQLKRITSLLRQLNAPKQWTRVLSTELSVFELALLRKSNGILTKSTYDLTQFTLRMNQQSKFLYELRRPFKVLKKDLTATSFDPPSESHYIMFQIRLDKDSRLGKYIEADCLNENAAKFIIRNFRERK